MSYNASYPTWFGQGQAPQYYKPAAQFSPLGGATSAAFAAPSGFSSARTLGATQTFGGTQAFAPQAFGTQALASTQFSSAFPTWFGAGPAPDYYKQADAYQPFAHGAGVHTGFHSGLQPSYFQGSTFGHAPTIASSQFSSAFPTWFGATSAPDFYKPAAHFDASSFGHFGAPSQAFSGAHALSGGHTLSHVVGHHGLSSQGASAAAFPTWFGSGAAPDFYKQAPTFDIGQQGFGGHQQVGQQQHQQHLAHGGHQGHAFLGAPQVPGAVDAQHHRLMNELLGFQWVGHGFHSGLRGPGVAIDTATGPSGLPQDPAHQQLMQEVRTFESHEKPGEHPGLKGSGTAIDQAAGPKDLPQDPEHKKLMEEVRTHSK